MSRTMTASGLSGRCLRRRSSSTARFEAASQTRWNPPSPLTAAILPSASSAASLRRDSSPWAMTTPSPSVSQVLGPHRGQALGWAWNLRSSGSRYSASQSGQSVNRAMDVWGRS